MVVLPEALVGGRVVLDIGRRVRRRYRGDSAALLLICLASEGLLDGPQPLVELLEARITAAAAPATVSVPSSA